MPFQKGNPGGPGRPTLTTEQKRVKALTARLKSRDFLDIVDKVIALAKRGERWAVEILFKYQIGLPKQSIELEHDGTLEVIVKRVENRSLPTNTDPETAGDQ